MSRFSMPLLVAALSWSTSLSLAETRVTPVNVTVDPTASLAGIEIAKEGALHGTKLAAVSGRTQTFAAEIPDPFEAAAPTVLTIRYLLVARWSPGPSEEVPLELKRGAPLGIEIDVMSIKSEGTRQEIEQIERLGKNNYTDQVRRFFWARAHHRNVRDVQRLPNHKNAIRSAKEWFDASYWLASRDLSVFRMDQAVVAIMNDYAEKAKANANFRKTFSAVVRPGYVEGMLKEISTTKFQMAALVQDAASRGDIRAARILNTGLLLELEQLPRDQRNQISAFRGVNLEQLRKNEVFLATKAKALGLEQ